VVVGANSRLDEAQAAILRTKLPRLPATLERLRTLGRRYREVLAGAPGLELLPSLYDGREPPWHQFVVTHSARDALREELGRCGIGTAVHYEPIPPRLSAFASAGSFPRAEALAGRALSLPFDPWLEDAQLEAVCDAVLASASSLASTARSRK
jgi:dTDP-3-amino-3,4,6-trideoxy-alpha-D-glucose transaminase